MDRRQFLRRAGLASAAGVATRVVSVGEAEASGTVIFSDYFETARSSGWGPSWYNPRYEMASGVSRGAAFYKLPNPQYGALRFSPNLVIVLNHDVADVDLLAEMAADDVTARFGVVARATSYSDCYAVYVDGSYLKVARFGLFGERVITRAGIHASTSRRYWLRVQVRGTSSVNVKAKIWPVGKPEPWGWKLSAHDWSSSRITHAGAFGAVFMHDAVIGWHTPTVRVASFKALSLQRPLPSTPHVTAAFAGRTVAARGSYRTRVVAKTDIPATVNFQFSATDPQLSTYRTVAADENHAGPATAKGWLDGLPPGSTAYWRAEATTPSGRKSFSPIRKLSTPPAGGQKVAFAFGSCTHIMSAIHSFATAASLNPMFFVHLGDFAYANAPQGSAAGVRADFFQDRWSRALATPAAERLLEQAAWIMVQDDHDYGENNSWSATVRPFTFQAWDQISGNLNERYFDLRYGDCHCFFIDTHRWADDPFATDGPSHTALGPAQKTWLKNAMGSSNAPLLVLFAPTPLKALIKNYNSEVSDLVSFMLNLQKQGHRVLICGGNAHAQYVGDFGTDPNYFSRLLEFASSGTERPGQATAGATVVSRVRSVQDVNAFGYVELGPAATKRKVTLRSISSERGTDVWSPLVLSVPNR